MDISKKKIRYQSLLEDIYTEERKRQQIVLSGDRTLAPNLDSVSEVLDEYYCTYKLNLYCAYLSYQFIVHEKLNPYQETDFLLIPNIIQLIESQKLKHPAILIYDRIRKLFESVNTTDINDKKQLEECISAIKSYEQQEHLEECAEMYSLVNNYCIKKINEGFDSYKVYFWKSSYGIVQIQYKSIGKTLQNIDPNLFRNTALLALSIKDHSIFHNLSIEGWENVQNGFDWVEQFINIYGKTLIKSNLGKIILQYCKAYLEFERGNFARAYKIFNNRMRVQNTFINLSMKALHLKILYEVNIRKAKVLEYDKIEIRQVLDAFRKLMKNEEKSRQALSYQLSIYTDFLAKYRKLLQFFYRYYAQVNNSQKPNFVQQKRELEDFITAKKQAHNGWFLSKLEAIQ
ncbi:MAG: hypothetical protein AAGG68_04665 [Bacteroidota bacterium]